MYLNLKLSIWQAGMRQNRLARALNIDEALLSKIINGFREPTAQQRRSIADLLQKDEQWLFVRNDHPALPPSNGGDPERNSR
jgi:transcriptional regulator with XRE-family HTH domain